MKKKKKQKYLLNFEALDRTFTIRLMLEELLMEHQSIVSDDIAKNLVSSVGDNLDKLYQHLGKKL